MKNVELNITEDFAISFASEELQLLCEHGIPDELVEDLLADFRELRELDSNVRLETGRGGYGAEILTLVVIFGAVFLSGKRIDENFAAWANMARGIGRTLARLRHKKRGAIAVSEPVALALAIEELSNREVSLDGFSILTTLTIPVAKSVVPPELVNDFRYQSDRFYLFVFRTGEGDAYVVLLRSSGEIEEVRKLPTGNWTEYLDTRQPVPEGDAQAP